MTKYEVITSDIRKKIQNGTYGASAQLPTEPEMCEAYKVSRITVKKAIDQLVMEGLVIKKRGSGTFVKGLEDHKGQLFTQLNGLYINMDKTTIHSEIVLFEVVAAGKFIADKLNIEEDAFVYHIIRYRYDDKEWRVLDFVYMPIDLIPGLKKDILYHSIYNYIENALGLRIQSAHRIIRAQRPDDFDKKWLGLKDTDPVLSIIQTGYLDNGVPFEYSEQHHIGDDFSYKTVSIR